MITYSIKEFIKLIPNSGALLGLDYGCKHIGIAISDANQRVAMPLYSLTHLSRKSQLKDIKTIVNKYKATGIVLGLPLMLDGTKGNLVKIVEAFASSLSYFRKCMTILLYDERFSSKSADRLLETMQTKKNNNELQHTLAAQILLSEVIESIRMQRKIDMKKGL
ncbi:Holliday junction resolvase RuvX [Candidatus Sneabacter namystus]|uniref:Putative pre-16S rRNA nuclease n=1 Tax=Candidatus Sneabacter namystus TaxID=2601646 RepID=A0A5C0UIF7_9RICK|nr:Holliday junction resolvase RuvX [Candidatus Sneabacter namystus]QEK39391.1 Holliday junction resolvase RuvX [Candidatus Sneabacter namystus]